VLIQNSEVLGERIADFTSIEIESRPREEFIDHSVSVGLQTDRSCEGSHSLSNYKPPKQIFGLKLLSRLESPRVADGRRLKQTQRSGRYGVLAIDGQIQI